jgi:deoxyribodipyrimidine photolyase-related protein
MPSNTQGDDSIRNLVIVLGDQLDHHSVALDSFDPSTDTVLMVEVADEAERVWSTKPRIAVFLSAMRHFRDRLRQQGIRVQYRQLDDTDNRGSLRDELRQAIREKQPQKLVVTEPGEWRVQETLRRTAEEMHVALEIRPDRHFLCSRQQFAAHAAGRKRLLMESFYREMRRQNGVLMDGDRPVGGKWNYDAQNRQSFQGGPSGVPAPRSFPPDAVTREVIALVNRRFAIHPGSLERFDWPLTPEQAQEALDDFVESRLSNFGPYQDAMWTDQPYLFHSRLSSAMNLKLLNPRDAIQAAMEAFRGSHAPLNSVEGFVRQILGWREYVRGIYWHYMPQYAEGNAMDAHLPLPGFYWTGETDMSCLQHCIRQTLEYGYAHHIQRLMVTGLFALLLGVIPAEVHRWYLAVYVDAVEWVELPNTLGMSQFADGGIMATKPYCATGKYIQRMSNYCTTCRYDPAKRLGEDACPYTTLYWDFLIRNEARLRATPRMALQLRNLVRLQDDERRSIRKRAGRLQAECTASTDSL